MKYEMKIQLIVLLALSISVTSRDYDDDDEGRPYEFGFTVDGQQHRHESKDVNGIVMGEFGFITADGIYHVTVYATDENGSFKILSMRNVRVSGPLDEPGYEFPSKTGISQYQPQNNPSPPPPPPPTTTLAPTTNFKAPYVFTTLPSLKVPSCSSCKLPSTTPKPPGASNNLPFQTPEFQDKKPGHQPGPVVPQHPVNNLPPFNSQSVPSRPPFNVQPVVPQNQPGPVVPQQPVNNLPPFNSQSVPLRPPFDVQPVVPQNQPGPVVPQHPVNNLPPFNSQSVPLRPPFDVQPVVPQNQPGPVVPQQPVNNLPPFNSQSVPLRPPFDVQPVVPQNQPGPVVPQHPVNSQSIPPSKPFNTPAVVPQIKPIVPLTPPINSQPLLPPTYPKITQRPPVTGFPKQGDNLDKFGVGILGPRYDDTPKPNKPSIEQQPPFQNPGNNYPTNAIPERPISPFSPTDESLQNPPNPGIQTPVKIPHQSSKPTNLNVPSSGPVGFPKPPPVTVSNNQINIPGKEPIPIKDSYPNMVDGLPNGITENDMLDLLYKFNYTLGFHGHHEKGLKNGAKVGAYFVNGRDGIMRVVEYIADENGYRPKVKFINLGLDSADTPKEGTEKTFGLKGFEFVWYPI